MAQASAFHSGVTLLFCKNTTLNGRQNRCHNFLVELCSIPFFLIWSGGACGCVDLLQRKSWEVSSYPNGGKYMCIGRVLSAHLRGIRYQLSGGTGEVPDSNMVSDDIVGG
jgi:hypothetical protein